MPSLADAPDLVGFFSYSREDDEDSGGLRPNLDEGEFTEGHELARKWQVFALAACCYVVQGANGMLRKKRQRRLRLQFQPPANSIIIAGKIDREAI